MSEQVEPFVIYAHLPKIVLRGDLDDSSDVLSKCRLALENVPKFSRLTVEADSARVVPDGVTIWIQAVEQFLMGCELVYAPSQLSLILQYDSRYQHPKSSFREYGVVSDNASVAAAR